ncbi:MAG: hypothetical protein HY901_28865 [Deltaproteobacteria bacterium]|nr:hypothetical protein [Deltaproteobacteria bacterium]
MHRYSPERVHLALVLLAVCLLLAACAGSTPVADAGQPISDPDAAQALDAGAGTDASGGPDAAPPDGSSAPDASPSPPDAGSSPDAGLDLKCTPTFTLQLEDTGPKGQVFADAVPDPEAFAQETGRTVCKILYRSPEEVRDANHLTLIIRDDPQYPGWKAGDVGDITVMISSDHLAKVKAQGQDVAREIRGILLHEMTHMYQHDDKAPGEGTYGRLGNVIEGVADAVRIRAGYPPTGARPSKSGAWDDAGYAKPAFFLLWVDGRHAGFLHDLNLSMVAGDGVAWTPDAFLSITGVGVDALWSQYAGAACCSGTSQLCCN